MTKTKTMKNVSALLATGMMFALTGCAGSNDAAASGTYYGQTGKGSDPAIITLGRVSYIGG